MAQNKNLAPIKAATDVSRLKDIFQKPALTSFFQCWFYPTKLSQNWIKERGYDFSRGSENISLLCHEASLPGTVFATNEITNDFTGVTERLPYRKQFDDRADFTFYVDHNGADGGKSHDIIWFFEHWVNHIAEESVTAVKDRPSSSDRNYFYRFNFPKSYRTDIYVNKFERDFKGTYLQYNFLQAYPVAISAMPLSYDSSQLLKCTVSFTFIRYNVYREYNYGIVGQLRNNTLLNDPLAALNPYASTESENFLDTLRKATGGVLETFGSDGTKY